MKDAAAHAKDDEARRAATQARNEADALVYSVEKTVKEHGATLQGEQLATVDSAIGDVKTALASNDAALTPAVERLQRVSQGLAEQLYRQTQGQPGGGASAGSGAGSPHAHGDVVEGEVVATSSVTLRAER